MNGFATTIACLGTNFLVELDTTVANAGKSVKGRKFGRGEIFFMREKVVALEEEVDKMEIGCGQIAV